MAEKKKTPTQVLRERMDAIKPQLLKATSVAEQLKLIQEMDKLHRQYVDESMKAALGIQSSYR